MKFSRKVGIRISDPYRDTGKTCLGGGIHCPGAFSYVLRLPS